jgi:hypothetical protein
MFTGVAVVPELRLTDGDDCLERLVTMRNRAAIITNGEPGVISKSLRNGSLIEAKQEEFQVSGKLRDWRVNRWR